MTRGSIYRILVADDEEAMLRAYRHVLQPPEEMSEIGALEADLFGAANDSAPEISFEIVYCRQGDEAVDAARRAHSAGQPFVAAFLDVRMPPGPNGVETAEQIRHFDQEIHIVFVTGFSDVRPAELSRRLPPPERLFYLAKPFQPAELTQFAMTLAHKWRVERELANALDTLERQNHALLAREQELREQNQRFDAALSNMSQGLCLFDANHRLVVCNKRFLNMHDLAADVVHAGISLEKVIRRRLEATGAEAADVETALLEHLAFSRRSHRVVRGEELPDGRILSIVHNPMADGSFVQTFEDITEQRQAQKRVQYLAYHDVLTDLPNRALFNERLEQEIARSRRRGDKAAVLYLDLDHFKIINDTFGHQVGDALLVQVALRIRDCVRDEDIIARLGGDEFAIVQTGLAKPEESVALAQRLVSVLREPFNLDGHQVVTGASVGISIAPDDGEDPVQIVKNADLALYRAKSEGRNDFRFFEPEMSARIQARRLLEVDLRRALREAELEVHYQPLVNLGTRELAGAEALVRWRHPQRGIIMPGEFIPLAEETGLIEPVGEFVLRRACLDAASWPQPLRIAVNLSAVQFSRPTILTMVKSALQDSGLAPGRLELEVTESVLLRETDKTLNTLHNLRDMGIRISMDDFGTGYSSLSYLRSFPFDKIKIDRSFVHDLGRTRDAAAIVQTVVKLGTELGIATTAEGLESKNHESYLREIGCTEGQGFYYSQAVPTEVLVQMLRKEQLQLHEFASEA